jgi:hypothetical protein
MFQRSIVTRERIDSRWCEFVSLVILWRHGEMSDDELLVRADIPVYMRRFDTKRLCRRPSFCECTSRAHSMGLACRPGGMPPVEPPGGRGEHASVAFRAVIVGWLDVGGDPANAEESALGRRHLRRSSRPSFRSEERGVDVPMKRDKQIG